MILDDDIGLQLHDRATRGEALTPEERSQLEDWYLLQDAEESELLQQSDIVTDIAQLQSRIDTALSNIALTTQRIQQVVSENKTIRNEIATLQQQLSCV
ncbi:MAG: hypothetical protein AAFQ74_17005 [Cyanobacteria bacterium J06623_4]